MAIQNAIKKLLKRGGGGLYAAFVPLSQGTESSPLLSGILRSESLPQFLNGLFKFAIAIGAMLAVLQFARAGFMYMTSDVWSDKSHAKEILADTILGLFLLLAVWLILNTINPDILNLDAVRNITPATK